MEVFIMAHENVMLRVSSSELRRRAEELRNFNTNLRTEIKNMEGREARLSGMWEGDARNEFHNQFNTNKSMFQNFCTLIDKYVVALEDAATEYDRREADNVQIART